MSLSKYLNQKGYVKKKLKLTKTSHFKTTVVVNGVKGKFIVDTGASNTCIDKNLVEKFKLSLEQVASEEMVSVGAKNNEVFVGSNNTVKLSKWKAKDIVIVAIDLDHVNYGLTKAGSEPVDGILGADILKQANVVIDYKKNIMYLK